MAVSVYVRSRSPSNVKQRIFSKISVSKEETTTWSSAYEPPFPERGHTVVGYCKGLFCLEFENGKTLIWNPSRKEFKVLPPSQLRALPCPSPNCQIMDCSVRTASGVRGLGFDPELGDYKVVTLAANFYCHGNDTYSTKQMAVYSLKNDSWEEICAEGDEYYILDDYATTDSDGSCYWISQSSTTPGYLLISLNLSNYKLSIVSVPRDAGLICFAETGAILTNYESSLAFIVYGLNNRMQKTYKTMSCWVRGSDGEWIQTVFDFKYSGAEKPLGFCGDILMLEGIDGGLLIYDSRQKLLSEIEGIYNYSHSTCIFPFTKNKVHLAPVREGKVKAKRQ